MPKNRVGAGHAQSVTSTRKRKYDGMEIRRVALELPVDMVREIDEIVARENREGWKPVTRTSWIRQELTAVLKLYKPKQAEIPQEAYEEVK